MHAGALARWFGTFNYISWGTMPHDGPVIAKLFLEGVLDEDAGQKLPQVRSWVNYVRPDRTL